jgi:hypothetical protein
LEAVSKSKQRYTKKCANVFSFAKQDLDTEIIVATARTPDATAVSANVVLDERQMNALFLDLVSYFLLQLCLEQWKVYYRKQKVT